MWLKIDDRIVDHPKMFAAARHLGRRGHARAFGVYMAGLCYANGHLTDGFLAESVVLSFKIDTKPTEVAAVLSFPEIQLWEVVAGGWRIHDYHQFNPKAEDVKEKLAIDRERKRLERAGKGRPRQGAPASSSGGELNANRSPIDHESVANRSRIDRESIANRSPVENSFPPQTVDFIENDGACPDGIRSESSALARARSRPDPDPVPVREEDHAALRTANGGKPVENRRPPVEATNVLRALIWREVAALADCGPLDPADVLEHLKCKAARAGLIYGVDDFHNQAALAIDRFSANVGRIDANRNTWRAAARAGR